MELTAEQIRLMQAHAEASYPRECCGFLLKDGSYLKIENTHETPESAFQVADADFLRYASQLAAVVHSHPCGTVSPSAADMRCQQEMAVPWVIIPMNKEQALTPYAFGDSVPIRPLEGRPYISGVYDCFTCTRDYYRMNYGVTLPNPPRDHDWHQGKDVGLMSRTIEECKGLYQVVPTHDLQPGDMLAFTIKSSYVNHVGLYLGKEDLLHHVRDQLSAVDNIARYMKRVVLILRINR